MTYYQCDDCPRADKNVNSIRYHSNLTGHSYSEIPAELEFDVSVDGTKVSF